MRLQPVRDAPTTWTMDHHGRRPTALLLLCALLAVLAVAPAADAAPARYSLAIGDSVPYGVVNGAPGNGARFSSFVDLIEQRLQPLRPGHAARNYSCPGATTADIIGPAASACQDENQYDPHAGSQLDAALAFLAGHPGEVSPVLVTAGGNDLLTGVDPDAMQARLGQIVAALRAAAPGADIVVTGYGDPMSLGQPGQAARYTAHAAFNSRLRTAATGAGAVFVDPHPVFNAPPASQDAAICTYLRACDGADPHPTDAGHAVYADLVWTALGYDAVAPQPAPAPDPAPVPPTPVPMPDAPAPTRVLEPPVTFGVPSSPGSKVDPVDPSEGEVKGARAAAPARFGRPRLAKNRRSLRVWLKCSAENRTRCRVRVIARQGTRRLGTATVRVRPGRTATVRVRFRKRMSRGGLKVRVSAYLGTSPRPAVRLIAR